jgi:hypothetical protein
MTTNEVSNAIPADHAWPSQDRGQAGAPTFHTVQSMGMPCADVLLCISSNIMASLALIVVIYHSIYQSRAMKKGSMTVKLF